MKTKKIPKTITVALLLILSSTLFAFEGRIFSVTGKNVIITGTGVAHLKTGQKFGVYSGESRTGEIVILQASHTQAKAKITSGTVVKDASVREIVVEKKEEAETETSVITATVQ